MDQHTLQQVISGGIFVLTYVFIVLDKFDRTVVALTGTILMIITGMMNQENAFYEIDYNTLGLLISMMVIVMIISRTGMFEFLAIKLIKAAKGEPWKIIVLLSLATGIISAMLDNVTTILFILPLTMRIARDLHINPVPFIISEVFASNVGGTATLIGDPPNIMIGSCTGLSFVDFIKNDAVIILPLLFLTTYIFVMIYRKKLKTTQEAKDQILAMIEEGVIKDHVLMVKSLVVLGLIMVGFLLHSILHFESATVAIAGAVLLLAIAGLRVEKVLREVEWKTIFFFVGLFILVGGVKESGLITILAKLVLDATGGNLMLTALGILWISAIASAFIDNIPFVATMIPMIKDIGTVSGINISPLWWALSMGACLGGNGTVIGASANVIAAGIADEHRHKISFKNYFKVAFPIMLLTVAVCTAYLYMFYL